MCPNLCILDIFSIQYDLGSELERSGARACSQKSTKVLVEEALERIQEQGQSVKGSIVKAKQQLTDNFMQELDQGITALRNWHDKQTEDDHEVIDS